MFHEGDLQSGISRAVQESKLVACFVTDDGEESNKWENEFLEEPDLKTSLSKQTVLLRLKAGSQEAGYLAAIFPLPKTPTLVLIKNGDLKEYLAAGITRVEFLRRMRVVLGSPTVDSPAIQDSQSTVPTITGSNEAIPTLAREQCPPETELSAAPSSSQQSDVSSSARTQQSSSDQLAERVARLVKQKKEKDQEKQKESKGKGKGPAETSEKSAPTSSVPTADMKYAQMQKKRQQEARDERARILKRVEDDKAQRRQDAAERKAKAKADAVSESEIPATGLSSNRSNHPATQSAECAVQVRLFDGSTIRSRFPSHGNIRANVRPWIDEKQEGGIPYGFKQVLTPLPNKNISISEEEESLQELGLTPSGTLILMPINDYASAYECGGASGVVYRSATAGYNLVTSGVGMVTGVLGSLLGGGAATPAQELQENPPPSTTASSTINVRTLRDQQRPDDQQFYNGNALNFEPRRDDDDKKED